MSRRIISLLVCVVMIATLLPITVFSASADEPSIDLGTMVGTGYDGSHLLKSGAYKESSREATITLKSWIDAKVTTTTISKPLDVVLVVDISGSMARDMANIKKGNKGFNKDDVRIDTLKAAANSFLDKLAANGVANGVEHKVSLVQFGHAAFSASGNHYGAKIVNDWTTNISDVKSAVSGLKVNNDYTHPDYGFSLLLTPDEVTASGATDISALKTNAKGLLSKVKSDDNDKVVIFITDGVPGDYAGQWDSESGSQKIADRTVKLVNQIKSTYNAKVFAVGMGDMGLSNSVKKKMHSFMSSVASNPSYCIDNAVDTVALNAAFDTIEKEIVTSQVDITSNAYFRDTVSEYFDSVDASTVKVYTEDFTGLDSDNNQTFGNKTLFADANVVVEGKDIKVTNFDYFANKVYTDSEGNHGKRLVVEFTTTLLESAYKNHPGENLPTNDPNSPAAIIDGTESMVVINSAQSPVVHIPARYNATVNYLYRDGEDLIPIPSVDSFVTSGEENQPYDVTSNDKISIDGYEYSETTGDSTTGIYDGDKEINVIYEKIPKYTLTINYLEEGTEKPLNTPFTVEELRGTSYDYSDKNAIAIDGYDYVRTDNDSALLGTFDADKTINVYYTKVIPSYTVTIKYVNENGEEIHQCFAETLSEGSDYDYTSQDAISIVNYVYVRTDNQDLLAGQLDGDKEITVVYREKYNYSITVNYVDEDGNTINPYYTETGMEGSDYDVTSKDAIEIDGYTYKETTGDAITGSLYSNKEITVVYTKNVIPEPTEEVDDETPLAPIPKEDPVTPTPPTPVAPVAPTTPVEPPVVPTVPTAPTTPGIVTVFDVTPLAPVHKPMVVNVTSPLLKRFIKKNKLVELEDETPLADAPKTGDESPIFAWTASLVASFAGAVVVTKRKKNEED